MEMKPEVVVLAVKDVDGEELKKVLRAGQDDEARYSFRFIESDGKQFPEDLVAKIQPRNLVIYLWDPKKRHSIDWFKRMFTAMQKQGKKNSILFCHTGNQALTDEDRKLLEKWKGNFKLTCETIEEGIDAEAAQKLFLDKVFELTAVKKAAAASSVVSSPASVQKAYFEYGNAELNRKHSRQKRADFIKANFNPDAQGQFSVEQLMQLFAVYMSTPLGSELSKTIEKVLAKALMSEAENTEYLAKIDSGRSTVMGKGWDWVAKKLRELLVARFTAAHKDINFDRVMNTLVELQNCVTSQETAWGYKLWGGEEQVQLVGATIENTMNVMMRMYPCLLKPEITAADLPALKIGGLQLPTEVVDIIDKLFVKPGNGLGM